MMAIIFKVAKVSTFPLSVNQINFDLSYINPKISIKSIKIIKLKTLETEKWVKMSVFVSQFSDWVYYIK